jgi:hypothetical protein
MVSPKHKWRVQDLSIDELLVSYDLKNMVDNQS